MIFEAEIGLGCDHCPWGRPITEVHFRGGRVRLCLRCTLAWFPGRDAGWFEERHAPVRDHLGARLRRAIKRELRQAMQSTLQGVR